MADQKCDHLWIALHSTPCISAPGLGGQFIQQRLGLLEVGSIESFGEPVVDFGEHRVRFVAAAGIAQQAVGNPAKVSLLAAMRKLLAAVCSVAIHRRPFTLAPIFPPVAGGAVTSGA